MSVSSEQKKEIIEANYKSPCCRRALLYGMLFAKGRIEGPVVTLVFEKNEHAEFASNLVREFLSKSFEIFRKKAGGRCVYLSFKSVSASKYISDLGNHSPILRKCSSCQSAFLRGVFLVGGRVSDPKKQFALEFSLGERTDIFIDLLRSLSLSPLVSRRKSGDIVYFRNSNEIEDFYGYIGLNKAVFEIIEVKINNDARITSQRFLNCVTNNYKKMTDVSERQLAIINKLAELNLLSMLPEELEATARIKMQFPDLPLSLLAAEITPAISKSGLSHRLKKIEEIGARLLKLDTKS